MPAKVTITVRAEDEARARMFASHCADRAIDSILGRYRDLSRREQKEARQRLASSLDETVWLDPKRALCRKRGKTEEAPGIAELNVQA